MKKNRHFFHARPSIPAVCLIVLLVCPILVRAQPISAVAALPVAEQRKENNQRILQRWAISNVRAYQDRLTGTALGDATVSGRRIVDLGNADDYRRQVLAAPEGEGRSMILWDSYSTPTFDPDDNCIHFPASNFTMNGGTDSTVWHEFNHALIDLALGNLTRGLANPLPPPDVWAGHMGGDRDEDHYYIEGIAERTMEWLYRLLKQGKFEGHVVRASAEEKQERDAGKKVNWHREHEIWQRPAQLWADSWPMARKILPLPRSHRPQYDQFCSVSLPLPEEVQRFYITGGIREAGIEVKVHEWVVAHRRVLCDVLIKESRRTGPKVIKKNMVSSFELRLKENYMAQLPATRGMLNIFIRGDDNAAWLDVSVGGKSFAGIADKARPGRWFEIDLATCRQKLLGGSPVVVKAIRPLEGLHKLMKDKTYSIGVMYRDPSSSASPSIYKPAEAQFSLKITPGDLPTSDPVPSGQTSSNQGTAPQSGRKMRYLSEEERNALTYWELYEENSKQGSSADSPVRSSGSVSGTSGSASVTWRYKDPRNDSPTKDQMVLIRGESTWTPPPKRFVFGQPVKMNWNTQIHGWSFGAILKVFSEGMAITLKDQKKLSAQPGTNSDATGSWEGMLVPPSNPKQNYSSTVTLNVKLETPTGWYLHQYRYRAVRPPEFVPDNSPAVPEKPIAPPPKATPTPEGGGEIVRVDIPRTPPPDKDADNVPPEPGEVIPLDPPEVITKPTPPVISSARLWYKHPSGDYRFPLPAGWQLGPPTGGLDPVMSPDRSMVIFCGRDFGDLSKVSDPIAAYTKHLENRFAGVHLVQSRFGSADAILARTENTASGQTQWQLYLLFGRRAYYVMISTNTDPAIETLPKEIADMLDASLWPN